MYKITIILNYLTYNEKLLKLNEKHISFSYNLE